jgi:hypothetical protein
LGLLLTTRQGEETSEQMNLRNRIDELEKLLGIDADYVLQLRGSLRLGMIPCTAIGFISKRSYVSTESLFVALYGDRKECEQPNLNMVSHTMWRVRRRLIPLGVVIDTQHINGYSMTPANKQKLHDYVDAYMATLSATPLTAFYLIGS